MPITFPTGPALAPISTSSQGSYSRLNDRRYDMITR
jgi:hypothetical protein